MKWDDLVLRFELQCNLCSYLESANLSPEVSDIICSAMKTHS